MFEHPNTPKEKLSIPTFSRLKNSISELENTLEYLENEKTAIITTLRTGSSNVDSSRIKDLSQIIKDKTSELNKKKAINTQIESLSLSKQQYIQSLFICLPDGIIDSYTESIAGCMNRATPVDKQTGISGLLFELEQINNFITNSTEKVDFSFDSIPIKLSSGNTSSIQIDIPINRKEKPYIFEVKNYPRLHYGGEESKIQLLKYKQAIEQGLVTGASIGIKGNLDKDFLTWAKKTIPEIEIIYFIELPGDVDYPVVLQEPSGVNGLDIPLPPIESEQNKQAVLAIQKSVRDESISRIVTSEPQDDPEQIVNAEQLANPLQITEIDIFNRYKQLKKVHLYQKLQENLTNIH